MFMVVAFPCMLVGLQRGIMLKSFEQDAVKSLSPVQWHVVEFSQQQST
jgi:hypothetical protein